MNKHINGIIFQILFIPLFFPKKFINSIMINFPQTFWYSCHTRICHDVQHESSFLMNTQHSVKLLIIGGNWNCSNQSLELFGIQTKPNDRVVINIKHERISVRLYRPENSKEFLTLVSKAAVLCEKVCVRFSCQLNKLMLMQERETWDEWKAKRRLD